MNNFNSNWILGENLKIEFTANGPIVTQLNSNYSSNLATASPSDHNGNLLGFSNGNDVYDNNGSLVGQMNGSSRSRALIAIPSLDCSDNIYYVTIDRFPEWGPIGVYNQSNDAYPFDNEVEVDPSRKLKAHLYSSQSGLTPISIIGGSDPSYSLSPNKG